MNTTIISFDPISYLHQACFVSNAMGKVVDLTTLNIFRNTRAMWILACDKVEGSNIESQKTSTFKYFSLPRYSKKWTAQ